MVAQNMRSQPQEYGTSSCLILAGWLVLFMLDVVLVRFINFVGGWAYLYGELFGWFWKGMEVCRDGNHRVDAVAYQSE